MPTRDSFPKGSRRLSRLGGNLLRSAKRKHTRAMRDKAEFQKVFQHVNAKQLRKGECLAMPARPSHADSGHSHPSTPALPNPPRRVSPFGLARWGGEGRAGGAAPLACVGPGRGEGRAGGAAPLACVGPGRRAPPRTGDGQATRLDAASLVGLAQQAHQDRCLDEIAHAIEVQPIGSRRFPWLWLDRSWDETPQDIGFGSLAEFLRLVAKFWWRDAVGDGPGAGVATWHQLSYEEFVRRGLSREPKHGTVQIMAQQARLRWCQWSKPHGDGNEFPVVHRELLCFPPKFLATNDAQSIGIALEAAAPFLELSQWLKLRYHVPVLVLSATGDLDAPIVRVKHWMGQRIVTANSTRQSGEGVVLLLDMPCFAHILNTISARSFEKARGAPREVRVGFLSSSPCPPACHARRLPVRRLSARAPPAAYPSDGGETAQHSIRCCPFPHCFSTSDRRRCSPSSTRFPSHSTIVGGMTG